MESVGWKGGRTAALALVALAVAVVALALSSSASEDGPWAALSLAEGQASSVDTPLTVMADGEAVSLRFTVASGGLEDGEVLYIGAQDLPKGWSQDVPGAPSTSRGFQLPAGSSEPVLDLDLGGATPAGSYPVEVRLDRSWDLTTLATLRLNIEVTSYAFTAMMDGLPTSPVAPGARVTGSLWLAHDAPQSETAVVSVRSAPPDWTVFVGQPQLAVASGSRTATQFLVQVPEGAEPGASTVAFDLTSPDPRFTAAIIEAVVDVAEQPGLSFVTASPPPTVSPGGSATVVITVANSGNVGLRAVRVGLADTSPAGWSVSSAQLPKEMPVGSAVSFEATLHASPWPRMPIAGAHSVPLVLISDVMGVELRMTVRATVPEVRSLAFAPVNHTDISENDVAYSLYMDGTLSYRYPNGTVPPAEDPGKVVYINPYSNVTGRGYVEVVDMGNLGRYRDVAFSAVNADPVVRATFTKPTVSLWSGRSWVVGVDVTVRAATPEGSYTVLVTATDGSGSAASTTLDVVVVHVSARLDGDLVPMGGAADPAPYTGTDEDLKVGVGGEIVLSGTVVSTCSVVIPVAEVQIYDISGDKATLYTTISIENLSAEESRAFFFTYEADEPGDHRLEAQLLVPGAVPPGAEGGLLADADITTEAAVPDWGVLLLPIALGAVAGLGAGLIAILGTEAGKWALLVFVLVPLYTRLKPDQVKDQFVRGQILGYVKANPGETYASIKRALRLSNGQFVYHARVLESQGLIRSVKDGANRRFYPAEMRIPKDVQDLKLNHVQRIIYTIVMEYPGISQRKLAKMVNLSPSTVSYHVNIMTKVGVIERRRSGRLVLCFANGDLE